MASAPVITVTHIDLLDYFAAHALVAWAGKPEDYYPSEMAYIAYNIAEAMLAEREKRMAKNKETKQ